MHAESCEACSMLFEARSVDWTRPVLPRIKGDKRPALRTLTESMLKAHGFSSLTIFALVSDCIDDHPKYGFTSHETEP